MPDNGSMGMASAQVQGVWHHEITGGTMTLSMDTTDGATLLPR